MKDRLLWLLKNAGPHRACELATVVGETTAAVQQELAQLLAEGKVRRVVIDSSTVRWEVAVSTVEPQLPGQG